MHAAASPNGGERGGRAARVVGRYCLYDEIASGGMAAVHLGRLVGPVGFGRTVAIKQLHAHLAKDPEFVTMFLDEARLAARIHHPNVVPTLDIVPLQGEVFLVMEYVHGESLFRLMRASAESIPPNIIAAIAAGALHGLHAAHEARNEHGEPLNIVHRDISPQNIIVGLDGVARVLDFGVAKATDRAQSTQDGTLKGKLRYMSPEQVRSQGVNRQTDVYAMAVVMHEMITRRSLFYRGGDAPATMNEILHGEVPRPSSIRPDIPARLDEIVMRGLARDTSERYPDARTMALEIEDAIAMASPSRVATWVTAIAQEPLRTRMELVSRIESDSARTSVTTPSTDIVVTPLAPGSTPTVDPQSNGTGSGIVASQVSIVAAPPKRSMLPIFAIGCAVLLLAGGGLIAFSAGARSKSAKETTEAKAAVSAPPPAASTAEPMPSALPSIEASAVPTMSASAAPHVAVKPVKPVTGKPTAGKPDDDNFYRTRK